MQNMGLVVVDQKPCEFKPEDGEEYGYLYDSGSSSRGRGPQRRRIPHTDALNAPAR